MTFTLEHDTFIVMAYFRSGVDEPSVGWQYSVEATYKQFLETFPEVPVTLPIFKQHCMRAVERYLNTGGVMKSKSTGRPPFPIKNVIDIAKVKMENQAESGATALNPQLKLHPYRFSLIHAFEPLDHQKRIKFCKWFHQCINENSSLDHTFFSTEAWFHLDGYINSENFRMWSGENSHVTVTTSLHPVKVGVWVAMSRQRIIGPYFFNFPLSSERYIKYILEPFVNQLSDQELKNGYFQQDLTTTYTSRPTLDYLQQYFQNRVICKGIWPSKSPDLTPLDYFLLVHLKNKVFSKVLQRQEELEARITEEIANITPETLKCVFDSLKRRVDLCLENGGGHFEQFL